MKLENFLIEIVDVYLEMAPYLLLGLTFAGILHVIFSKEFVARHLGGNNVIAVLKAAIFGVPLPLCSCGVVPTALSLRKSNASEGATISFLISTPQTGVDSIIATYGMMGPIFAIFRPIAAFLMGIIGGIATNIIGIKAKKIEQIDESSCNTGKDCNGNCELTESKNLSILGKIKSGFKYGYIDMLDDISKQIVVGILLSAVISFFIPDDFFTKFVGNSLLEMLIMIIGGVPLYICATGSIPIAMALLGKGVSAGAVFVFLAVGPATNAATITLIGNAMGKKISFLYVSVISVSAVIAGLILNFISETYLNGSISANAMAHHSHNSTTPVSTIVFTSFFSIIMLLSLGRHYLPFVFKKGENRDIHPEGLGAVVILNIEGMSCGNCVKNVEEAILSVDGMTNVKVDLRKKQATINGDGDFNLVKKRIENAGYTVL